MRLADLSATLIVIMFCGCSNDDRFKVNIHNDHDYVTRKTLETDKLASIWLIMRFVDKNAKVQFVNDQISVTNGIPLDVPEAELRRYANYSCFECIVQKHQITDPGVVQMARYVRDIELNAWGDRQSPEAAQLEKEIKSIIKQHPDHPEACLDDAITIFDRALDDARHNVRNAAQK